MPVRTDWKSSGLPGRVLLVEDNAIVAMNAEELLLEIGVREVVVAGTVAEANSCCDEHAIDFAVLDFDLGNETSLPVASRLHDSNIPIVFTSGFGQQVELPPELGGYPILTKPYLMEDLERTIRASISAN